MGGQENDTNISDMWRSPDYRKNLRKKIQERKEKSHSLDMEGLNIRKPISRCSSLDMEYFPDILGNDMSAMSQEVLVPDMIGKVEECSVSGRLCEDPRPGESLMSGSLEKKLLENIEGDVCSLSGLKNTLVETGEDLGLEIMREGSHGEKMQETLHCERIEKGLVLCSEDDLVVGSGLSNLVPCGIEHKYTQLLKDNLEPNTVVKEGKSERIEGDLTPTKIDEKIDLQSNSGDAVEELLELNVDMSLGDV